MAIYDKSISQLSNNSHLSLQHTPPVLQQQQQQQQPNSNNNNVLANANQFIGGFSSFDADSIPDYSEFDSESVTLDYFKERYSLFFFYFVLFCFPPLSLFFMFCIFIFNTFFCLLIYLFLFVFVIQKIKAREYKCFRYFFVRIALACSSCMLCLRLVFIVVVVDVAVIIVVLLSIAADAGILKLLKTFVTPGNLHCSKILDYYGGFIFIFYVRML